MIAVFFYVLKKNQYKYSTMYCIVLYFLLSLHCEIELIPKCHNNEHRQC